MTYRATVTRVHDGTVYVEIPALGAGEQPTLTPAHLAADAAELEAGARVLVAAVDEDDDDLALVGVLS